MNSKTQGAIGVGAAIAHYAAQGFPVFAPVADIARYDLIVDTGKQLLRVEVKTTSTANGQVGLRTLGGNQSWSGEVKRISAEDCDVVFCYNVLTGAHRIFSASEMEGRRSVTVR